MQMVLIVTAYLGGPIPWVVTQRAGQFKNRVLVTKAGSGWAEDAIYAVEHASGASQQPANSP